MISGKVWGSTKILLSTPVFDMRLLDIEPSAECSWHKHERKWNAFYVLEGELFIDVEKNSYALTDTTKLQEGDITTVMPNEFHRFRTGSKHCRALEIYYCEPHEMPANSIFALHPWYLLVPALSEDIVRKSVGRRAPPNEPKLSDDALQGFGRVVSSYEPGT